MQCHEKHYAVGNIIVLNDGLPACTATSKNKLSDDEPKGRGCNKIVQCCLKLECNTEVGNASKGQIQWRVIMKNNTS
jgi:hypothetical protein